MKPCKKTSQIGKNLLFKYDEKSVLLLFNLRPKMVGISQVCQGDVREPVRNYHWEAKNASNDPWRTSEQKSDSTP